MTNQHIVFAHQVRTALEDQLEHSHYRLPLTETLSKFLKSGTMTDSYLTAKVDAFIWFFNDYAARGNPSSGSPIPKHKLVTALAEYLIAPQDQRKPATLISHLEEISGVKALDIDIPRLDLLDNDGGYTLSVKYKNDNLYLIVTDRETEDTCSVLRLDHLRALAFVSSSFKTIYDGLPNGPSFVYTKTNDNGNVTSRAEVYFTRVSKGASIRWIDEVAECDGQFMFGQSGDTQGVRIAIAEEWFKKVKAAIGD